MSRACSHLFALAAIGLAFACAPALGASNSGREMPGTSKAFHAPGLRKPAAATVAIRLPAVSEVEVFAAKQANAGSGKQRLQIGIPRVAYSTEAEASALRWEAHDGGYVAHWRVASPGAKALRVALDVAKMAKGVELRFAGSASDVVYGPFSSGDMPVGDATYWSPVLAGEEARVEVFVAGGGPLPLDLAVTEVSHLFVDPADPKAATLAKLGNSAACEIDLICQSSGDVALQNAGKSVAQMTVTRAGATYLCSGTLVNPRGPLVPYLYSSRVCVQDQTEANTLTNYWFLDRTGCGSGGTAASAIQIPGGAVLLYSSSISGHPYQASFLRLVAPPPPGGWLSGWSDSVASGTPVRTIHHPQGDWKKIATGSVTGLYNDGSNDFTKVTWSAGVTEYASVGGGLFSVISGEYRLRGGMVDGASYCGAPASDMWDYYTRLDQVYPSIQRYLSPDGFADVTGGMFYQCTQSDGGALSCWGDNGSGKLGSGEPIHAPVPVHVGGAAQSLATISASHNHTCAVTTEGQVLCWGGNYFGELGNGTFTNSATPVKVTLPGIATAVAVGGNHSCALLSAGSVYCWGINTSGQLGNGQVGYHGGFPVAVQGLSGVQKISAGWNHTCALVSGGAMRCWGANTSGQLGNGSTSGSSVPVSVSGLSGIVGMATGMSHSCAVSGAGAMYCWGDDNSDAGGTSTINSTVPVQQGAGIAWRSVSAGDFYTCAISIPGALYCWGTNYFDALGTGAPTNSTVAAPTLVSALGTSGVTMVATARTHACALKGGLLYCWGLNDYGAVGDGTTTNRATPVQVLGLPGAMVSVAVGNWHSCGISSNARALCWGYNAEGQLGGGTAIGRATPVAVPGLQAGVQLVRAGLHHTCAINSSRGAMCWGSGGLGQLGNGADSTSSTPVPVSTLGSGVKSLAVGGQHTCALTGDGLVHCWGDNDSGQLGNGTRDWASTPVQVAGLSGIVAISAGWTHTCAVKYNGAVYCWGEDSNGALGLGATRSTLTPLQVGGLPAAIDISGMLYHQCALTAAREVWCWGNNTNGQLGNGSNTDSGVPVKVQGFTSPVAVVSAGMYHNCAITSAGAVMCWGYGGYGQIGDGVPEDSDYPVQVQGFAAGSVAVSAGTESCAVKDVGTVLCWGANNFGQVGDGTYFPRYLPATVLARSGAGSLDANNWYLDLVPGKAKSVSAELTPPVLSISQLSLGGEGHDFETRIKYKTTEFGRQVNNYVFGLVPVQFFGMVKLAPGAKTVAELRAKAVTGPIFAVLTPLGWTNLAGQLIAYSQGTANAAGSATNILNGVRLDLIPGAKFCVGYGTSATDMLTADSFREVLLVEGASAVVDEKPCVLSGVYLDGPRGSRFGTPVTFTASVIGLSPTGSVNFRDGAVALAASVPLAATGNAAVKRAAVTTSSLAPGLHALTAAYGGDGQNNPATSAVLHHEVSPATVSARVELEGPRDSVQGKPVFFWATVTGAGPTGSVQFRDGGAPVGAPAPLIEGVATLQVSGLGLGPHSITAEYLGDGANTPAASNTLVHTVYAAINTRVMLGSSANPAAFGAPVTFTATVTGSGTPAGQITFREGASVLARATLSGGVASVTLSGLAQGEHLIEADYSGDGANQAVTSDVWVQSIEAAFVPSTPNVFLTSTPNPSSVGQAVTFNAVVSGNGGAPAGTVHFRLGNGTLCTAVLVAGSASCVSSVLPAGVHLVTAAYSGGGGYTSATSSLVSQTVSAATQRLAPNPSTLSFGVQGVNTTSAEAIVTLSNSSGSPVAITGFALPVGILSSGRNTCGASIANGASCQLGFVFRPAFGGELAGSIIVMYSGGATVIAVSASGERSLVTHYYRSILRREPDAPGKAYWEGEASRVVNLQASVNEVWYSMAMSFFFSTEYRILNRDNAGFLTDLYNTFFARPPDQAGFDFWLSQMAGGMPREGVLTNFMFSPEFANFTGAIFGNTAARGEVNVVMDFYRGLLSRLPDTGGFNFYVGEFRRAQCQGAGAVYTQVENISSGYANSTEYGLRGRTNAQYMADLYNAFLRRGPDLAGINFYINQLNTGGKTREQVRQEFKTSPEFNLRVNSILGEACIP